MELIILPGNSINNKEPSERILETISYLFDDGYVHNYNHWQTGGNIIDFEVEIDRIKKIIDPKKEYFILAKSLGSVLAMKLINDGIISVKKCVFLGLPVNWCKNNNIDIDKSIKGFSKRLAIIQNTQDPTIPSGMLNEYLRSMDVKNHLLIEVEGSNHEYEDTGLIEKTVKEVLEEQ